jgi:Ni/Co efflux regulator RcnB
MKKMLIAVAMSLAILGGSAFAAQPQDRQDRHRTEVRHNQGRYRHHRRHHTMNTQNYRRSEQNRRDRPPG